jgi:hypothetical protein
VFGSTNAGISNSDDCDKLPEDLKAGCQWRFDWFKDASYPRYVKSLTVLQPNYRLTFHSANFKRVACPSELTDRTQCVRDDDKDVALGQTSPASTFSPSFNLALAVTVASLFSV